MKDEKIIEMTTTDGEKVNLKVETEKWYKKALNKTKEVSKTIVDTVVEHPIATIIIISSLTKLAVSVSDSYVRAKNANTRRYELEHQKRDFYDRESGLWYSLKRPMTTYDNIEFSRRRNAGESTYTILISMGLI